MTLPSFFDLLDLVRASGLNQAILIAVSLVFAISLFLSLREVLAWLAYVRRLEKRVDELKQSLYRADQRLDQLEASLKVMGAAEAPKRQSQSVAPIRFTLPRETLQ